jgi:hypothetical protein
VGVVHDLLGRDGEDGVAARNGRTEGKLRWQRRAATRTTRRSNPQSLLETIPPERGRNERLPRDPERKALEKRNLRLTASSTDIA